MDECLTVLRQLLTGAAVTFHGAFIDVEEAMILLACSSAGTSSSSGGP